MFLSYTLILLMLQLQLNTATDDITN